MSEEHVDGVVNGNGADGGTTTESPPIQGWQDWVKGLDKLNDTIEQKVAAKLDGITGIVQQATKPPEPTYEAPNFEEMSNSELASHMLGTVSDMVEQAINKALAPIVDQFGNLQRTVSTNAVGLEMKELQSAHKDLKDWKDEMIGLATQHPSLGLTDVYKLARANNPAKAGELDRRYNPPPPKPRPFGGLTPSMSGKASTPPMNAEEAGRSAYNEVMSRHPGVLPALQDL
jgi:hypothetical protein